MYLRLNFSRESKALNLRHLKLFGSYKETCSSNFSMTAIFEKFHVPFYEGGGERGGVRTMKLYKKSTTYNLEFLDAVLNPVSRM